MFYLFLQRLNDSNYLERVCLKEEKDYAEFKKEADILVFQY
ncbi:hypothetical protein T4A_6502 [Trichinella pseudospiralis]|uniref:Uncharacterized protein n=1 Tax=Trichinella pseudospiralis TaxID=6337 RepID=A0A0V1DLP3_TRIPS|nr:hypothetical protein T4A_6502 [Trichinella pseudospiralis]